MSAQTKRRTVSLSGFAVLYAAAAAVPLLASPGTHQDFEYLVAGVFATAISLSTAFIWYVKGWLYLPPPYDAKNCATVMIPK